MTQKNSVHQVGHITSSVQQQIQVPQQQLQQQPQQSDDFQLNLDKHKPQLIKGALIGTAVTSFIRWNMGKYSRLAIFRKRWALVRYIIKTNRKPVIPCKFTNYYTPNLDHPAKNFMCYSGETGIGKSTHFLNFAYTQSGIRPALYLSFKCTGKDEATFQQQLAQQTEYGQNSPGILSEVIKAIKIIDQINKNPHKFWLKVVSAHFLFVSVAYAISVSSIDAVLGMGMFGSLALAYATYLHFIYPLLVQSLRRTCPVLIFDDVSKIEHLKMFHQIARFVQLLDQRMASVILVSPDQDTWYRLRREPGLKDRLRVRQIFYNHVYTAESILKQISDDAGFEEYMISINGNKLYTKEIVISLVRELIGKRQVTLRRFTSLIILNDEEDYEELVQVLKESADGKISTGQAVQKLTDIIYESETKTMVANLKSIKRDLKLEQQEYLKQLRLLLKKRKLPSDSIIAHHLKQYSIVRDMQSEYLFNGRFKFTVFNIAIQEFERDLKQYKVKPVFDEQLASSPETTNTSTTNTFSNIR